MSVEPSEQAAIRRAAPPAPPAVPPARRPSAARRALAAVIELVSAGRYDDADHAARDLSFGSLVWEGGAPQAFPAGSLSEHWPEIRRRPALISLSALLRHQVSGDVSVMQPDLMRAARLLQKGGSSDPARRITDLTLAALCLLLASQPDDALLVAHRAAALLRDINELRDAGEELSARRAHLASVACDLAGFFALVGDTPVAAELWTWVRSVVSDPSSPLLAQVDIGLSCAVIFVGNRTSVNPLGHLTGPVDRNGGLWHALVMSARCYDRLDALQPHEALEASRSAVALLPDPYSMGSLVSAHVVALIASGYPAWAVDFLAAVDEHGVPSADASLLGQSRLLLLVAANAAAGRADAAAIAEERMPLGSPVRSVASAYRRLWAGEATEAGECASAIAEGVLSPRLESLRRMISAAARLRAGREELALDELMVAGALAELQGVRWSMLMIPRSDVAALTALATARGALGVLHHLPSGADVHLESVPRVDLTAREIEILELVARGLTNPEIAERVFISTNTVKYHLTRIYRRLGVSTRDEAVAFAYRLRTAKSAAARAVSASTDPTL